MIEREKLTDRTCARCGATIHLAKTGKDGWKWVTNADKPKDSWKCEPTRDFPVRAHSP